MLWVPEFTGHDLRNPHLEFCPNCDEALGLSRRQVVDFPRPESTEEKNRSRNGEFSVRHGKAPRGQIVRVKPEGQE